jgi:hypothetical protein
VHMTTKTSPDARYYKAMVTRMLNKFEKTYGKCVPIKVRLDGAESSNGRTYQNWIGARITVSFGTNRLDAKHVMIHELAHVLTPGHQHDAVFYTKFKELIRFYNHSMTYAIKREGNYKPRNSKTLRKRTKVQS